MWLSGLSAGLKTKGLLVSFPVRARTWVAGQVPSGVCERQPHIDDSLPFSPSLPLSLKINKNLFFKIILFYFFLERGREREREGENHQCVVAPHGPPTGDLDHNPGLCPDWELNWQPFGS